MHYTIHTVIFLFVTFFSFLSNGQREELPFSFVQFVQNREAAVTRVAAHATELHGRRVQLVRDCTCSKHSCSNDFASDPCVHFLGTPDFCEAAGRRIDFNASIVRTPPDTNPHDLSAELKESVCVYKGMQDIADDYQDEQYAWMFLGKYADQPRAPSIGGCV